MKPVEIEFIMRDKLSPGIDKAGKSAETLGDKAEQVSKSITDRIAAQKEQIKYVESCLKDLKKQYDNLAPGKAQLEMRAEIDACTKALQEDKNILSSLEAEHDKASVSTKRLSMQLREMQDAMARLRLEGKQNTKEYAEMADKAAVLADTIGDLRTQTNILANDDAALQGVMSGVNGLSGLFTTATGVMGIFASENEDLIKIQTRVQSVMAVTMGLQQVMNTLNKDSAFRLVTVVKMKKLLTAANTKLAVSLGISNAAATALMATLTLGLSAVITGLIVLWDKYSDAQEKAAEKAKERVKIESDGRAQMIKTRFEIENTTKSLKDFTGSKEQEKAKENAAKQAQSNDSAQAENKTEEEAVIYNCPSCGAQVVTTASTAATTCFYCQNPVVLGGRLSGEFKPDRVIPFKLSKQKAIDKFLEMCKMVFAEEFCQRKAF